MTKKEIPQAIIDTMSGSAMLKLKLALDIAFDNGGFEAVISVCKHIADGAARTARPVGIWADAEWRGLDFLESRMPGCTANFAKYIPDSLNEDAPFSLEDAINQLKNIKVDPVFEKMLASSGGSLTVGNIADSSDFSEEQKTKMLGALGYLYP